LVEKSVEHSDAQFLIPVYFGDVGCFPCMLAMWASHLRPSEWIFDDIYIYAWMNLDVQQASEEESDFDGNTQILLGLQDMHSSILRQPESYTFWPVASDNPKTLYS